MAAAWTQGLLGSFDLETTGTDPLTARIVSSSILLLGARFGVQAQKRLVDPGIEIPAEAAAIHGITTERARAEGRPAAEAVPEIADLLVELCRSGLPLVVYNAPYDLTVVECELRRYEQPALFDRCDPLVIDPLVIDRAMDRFRRGGRKLAEVCAHHGIRLDDAHQSHGDAMAAARLAWILVRRYPELGAMALDELHASQVVWRAEWAAEFEAYLRRRGGDEVVERDWPVRQLAGATS